MALYVARAEDGYFHCPEENCSRKYVAASCLSRHCRKRGFDVTTVEPRSDDDRKKKKREKMRAYRAKKTAQRHAHAPSERSPYTFLDAEERGVHGATDPWVEYRPSRLEGAGNGVFAVERFQRGDTITRCEGNVVKQPPQDKSYTIGMQSRSGPKFMDGLRIPITGEGLGSFVNKESRKHSRARKNCSIIQEGQYLYVVADTNICPGDELYTTYGKGYRL